MNTPVQTIQVFNKFSSNNALTATYTVDNDAGTAAVVTDIHLIAGVGLATATSALGTGVTMASTSFGSNADLQNMLQNQSIVIDKIVLQTNNTDNYSYDLLMADRTPNMENIQQARVALAGYREVVGTGYSNTLTIKDVPIVVLPQTYLKASIVKNSWLKVTYYYSYVQNVAQVAATGS